MAMDQTNKEKFCDFYKPLLVEEIALVDHPVFVHYGRCSVIGKLAVSDNKLLSLGIPELPSDMLLPDGACSVDISLDNYCGKLHRGMEVEIAGTVKLWDETNHTTTESGVVRSLLPNTEINKYVNQLPTNYTPFIEVDSIRVVQDARKLIACNLKLRKLKSLTSSVDQ